MEMESILWIFGKEKIATYSTILNKMNTLFFHSAVMYKTKVQT